MMFRSFAGKKGRLAVLLQRFLLFVLLQSACTLSGLTQCISTTAHSGTVFTSDNTIGSFAFSNVGNVSASDNQYATANALAALFNGNTEYLKITGFNFSVPATAVICGVTMAMECRATGITLFATVRDNDIRLVKNGTVTGTNQAQAGNWPGSEVNAAYGGINGLWGAFLTPQDVNSADFGIAISSRINGLVGVLPSVQIDHVSLTVHYSVSNTLPVQITSFTTGRHHNTIINRWQVTAAEADATLTLQRSADGADWQQVARYTRVHSTTYEHREPATDASALYYRLVLHAVNRTHYSRTNMVKNHAAKALRLYPNPAQDWLTIEYKAAASLNIYNNQGQRILVPVRIGDGITTVDIRTLSPGVYWLKTAMGAQSFFKL